MTQATCSGFTAPACLLRALHYTCVCLLLTSAQTAASNDSGQRYQVRLFVGRRVTAGSPVSTQGGSWKINPHHQKRVHGRRERKRGFQRQCLVRCDAQRVKDRSFRVFFYLRREKPRNFSQQFYCEMIKPMKPSGYSAALCISVRFSLSRWLFLADKLN